MPKERGCIGLRIIGNCIFFFGQNVVRNEWGTGGRGERAQGQQQYPMSNAQRPMSKEEHGEKVSKH